MAEYLKEFIEGEVIKASEQNSNNNYLLDQIKDSATTLNEKINTVNSSLNSQITTTLQSIYPVGSVYIGIMETCPLAALFGTWEKISEGRVLQGADSSHNAGTTIAAGLPNIEGRAGYFGSQTEIDNITDGAFYAKKYNGTGGGFVGFGSGDNYKAYFAASRLSSIYGNSDTVQPSAYVVNIWRRTA